MVKALRLRLMGVVLAATLLVIGTLVPAEPVRAAGATVSYSYTGLPTVGTKVSVQVKGSYLKKAKVSYLWYRNGGRISGANGASYKVASRDVGRKITVKVVVTRTGYRTLTRSHSYGTALAVAAPTTRQAKDVLAATNKYRASKKKPALAYSKDLEAAARRSAKQQAAKHSMFHSNYSAWIRSGWWAAAENVAMGYDSGKKVTDAWWRSSGHQKNMLGNYNTVGVGFATAKDGTVYWAQVFARY